MEHEASIKSFTGLTTWQEGHKLAVRAYFLTKSFQSDESCGLKPQTQRAAASVTSHIAEGFSMALYADKKHCSIMAHGSLAELQHQALAAPDIGCIGADFSKHFASKANTAHKLLTGLIKSTNVRKVTA